MAQWAYDMINYSSSWNILLAGTAHHLLICFIVCVLLLQVYKSERPKFVFVLFGEGNGNPLQYSCLENPMDGGALKATVHGVAKSRP